MARFDRLKCRALFEKRFGRITILQRLPVTVQAEKCLCGGHLCLKLVCDSMGEDG
jgi:hypothetical protein